LVGRIYGGRAALLSGGHSHHELLLIQISTADGPLTGRRIGLYHTGWKIGDSLEELHQASDRAQTQGVPVEGTADHGMIFSLYLRDPDGNEVELYVDNPDYDWQEDKRWIEAPARQLDLTIPRPNHGPPPLKRVSASQKAPHTAHDHVDRNQIGQSQDPGQGKTEQNHECDQQLPGDDSPLVPRRQRAQDYLDEREIAGRIHDDEQPGYDLGEAHSQRLPATPGPTEPRQSRALAVTT
jgi:catechol 2,3-dioxygenase